jgi:hypothetical protein
VTTVIVSPREISATEKLNARTHLMKVTLDVASRSSLSTTTKNVVVSRTNGNVNLVIVSPVKVDVMEKPNVMMAPMREINHAASKNTPSTTTKNVVASRVNGPVLTVTVSISKEFVTENPNVKMVLMKVTTSAASRPTVTIPPRFAAATQTLSGPAVTVTVSKTVNTVMVKFNVPMDLMRVILTAASKISDSTTTKNAAAKNPNGNVPTASASLRPTVVMVKPNVLMSLMKVTKTVASRTTNTTTSEDVVVIQKPSGSAQTVSASITLCTVTEHLNVPINPMKEWVNLT